MKGFKDEGMYRDMICASGTYDEVAQKIAMSGGISKELALTGMSVLFANPQMLNAGESIVSQKTKDRPNEGESAFIVGSGNYYINITKGTLLLCILLAGNLALQLVGIDTNPGTLLFSAGIEVFGCKLSSKGDLWFPLYEWGGEKCILLQVVKSGRTVITAKDVKNLIGKKCPGTYECSFVRNGKCKCKEKDIEAILVSLKEKGALKQSGAGYEYII